MVWVYTLNEVVSCPDDFIAINGNFEINGEPYNLIVCLYGSEIKIGNGSPTLTISTNGGHVLSQYREIILKDEFTLQSDAIGFAWLNANSVKSAPKTWIFYPYPSSLSFVDNSYDGQKFTSNGNSYNKISSQRCATSGVKSEYVRISYSGYDAESEYYWTGVYDCNDNGKTTWTDQAYRTITFENAPTGELLEWLQKVAYPEGETFVNRVVLSSGKILIDLSSDTVTPETLAEGVIAHDKDGKEIVGTLKIT